MIFLMTRNSFYLINFVSAIWQIRDIVNLLLILFFLALNYVIEFRSKDFKNILVYPILFFCILPHYHLFIILKYSKVKIILIWNGLILK